VEFSLKDGTLGDAFNAVVKADPRLEWRSSANGAIHFTFRILPFPA